ncbi:carbohydrate sulfotransferase 8-like isoform X1 [Solea solea]|uniref:carbohydrate sulfotransferase 8-like isoform X1 n=1 Tax=Solea solea TaxID=90069 RepID=UPI00272BAC8D|nr:carbohydrate sulfotransferase 8-like isoform X1 [Solea solea]XP_058485837.1 carbohydrate sulfotransferase 8-like isoform X1 [Solea solea]
MTGKKLKVAVDSLCRPRRRVRIFLSFLLVFAATCLVHFIQKQHFLNIFEGLGTDPLEDPTKNLNNSDAFPPGAMLGITPQQSTEIVSSENGEKGNADNRQEAEAVLTSLVTPVKLPLSQQDTDSHQRKLLKTSPPISHTNANNITTSSSDSNASVPSVPSVPDVPKNWSKVSATVKARRDLVKEMCAKYKSNIPKNITKGHLYHVFVEDKYKLLYCQVPKAGCSNWRRTLMVLSGYASNIENIKHDTVHYASNLRSLNNYDNEGVIHRLKTYTKVLFVREPMQRLVSAYRDKFENPNDYYHGLFGKPIISKYRVNASEEARKTGNGVTFKEFIQYLLDVHRPIGMDIHWNLVDKLCHPCIMNYDFIGKFENMGEESDFLLRLIGAPSDLKLPTFKDRNPKDKKTSTDVMESYFSQVTAEEKQKVYDFYYMDYQMFDYSKPFNDLH